MSSTSLQLDDFCRVCLLRKPSLHPLSGQCAAIMIPEMLYKMTGLLLNLQEPMPRVICDRCLLKLELSYSIAEEFRQQEETLRRFWWKGIELVDHLVEYERTEGAVRKWYSEEVLERLVGERAEVQLPVVKLEPVDTEIHPGAEDVSPDTLEHELELTLELVDLRTVGALPAEVEEQLLEPQVREESFDETIALSEEESSFQEDVKMKPFYLDREDEELDEIDNDNGDEDFNPEVSESPSEKASSEKRFRLPKDTLTCPECGKTYPHRKSLIRHFRRHVTKAKGTYRCEQCNWNFATRNDLRVHQIAHFNERQFSVRPRFVCKYCRKEFQRQSHLEAHEKRHVARHDPVIAETEQPTSEPATVPAAVLGGARERIQKSTFNCRYCGKIFVWQNRLKSHEILHEKRRAAGIPDSDPWVYRKKASQLWDRTGPEQPVDEDGTVDKGSTFFVCQYCQKPFQLESRLKQHEKSHERKMVERAQDPAPDGPHRCPQCPRTFTEEWKMEMHARRHATVEKGIFRCKTCDHSFAASVELRRHERIHQVEPNNIPAPILILKNGRTYFKCRECGKLYDSRSNYFQHSQIHVAMETGAFECPDCGKRYGQRSRLRLHQKQKHNASFESDHEEAEEEATTEGPLLHCEECDTLFSTEKNFQDHLKGHASDGIPPEGFIVEEIPDPVASQKPTAVVKQELTIEDSQLQEPSTEAASKEPAMVEIPVAEPTSSSGTSAATTEESTNAWICNECGTSLSTYRTYMQHVRQHENIRTGRFKCEVCQLSFARQRQLLRHKTLKHGLTDPTDGKTDSQECDECHKRIKIKLFRSHVRYHENIRLRRYVCELCDKPFGSASHLKDHVKGRACEKTTDQEGKYECNECGKKYDNCASMDSHMRMHRNLRVGRYRCEICQEVFAGRRLLEDHTMKIHKQIPS